MERLKRILGSPQPRPEYQYDSLPNATTYTRLFRLLPRDSSAAEICGTLIQVPIDSMPSYKAISYMCGHDKPEHLIVVDAMKFMVRRNLFDFLSHQGFNSANVWLWIDAICISQDNLPEKGAQVRMMGSIYKHADSVLVWLGLAEKDSEYALGKVLRFVLNALMSPRLH